MQNNNIDGTGKATNEVSVNEIHGASRINGNRISSVQNGLSIINSNGDPDTIQIINNMISCKDGTPFYSSGTYNLIVYYNSFYCYGKTVSVNTCDIVNVNRYNANTYFMNNICHNDSGGIAISSFEGITNSDYNNYYTSGTYLIQWQSAKYKTLSALKLAESVDHQSISVKTDFVSSSNLHLIKNSVTNVRLKMKNLISDVSTDIDGDKRDTAMPCIGADETKLKYSLPSVSGRVYYDFNYNHKKDTNDLSVSNYKVKLMQDSNTVLEYLFTDKEGNYFAYTGVGKYLLKAKGNNDYLKCFPNDTIIYIKDSITKLENIDFGVLSDTLYQDFANVMINRGIRKDRVSKVNLIVLNNGNLNDTPTVLLRGYSRLRIDSVINIELKRNLTKSGKFYNDSTFSFKPDKIKSYSQSNFLVYVSTTDSSKIGDKAILISKVIHDKYEEDTLNNYDTIIRVINNSYDPNLKHVSDSSRALTDIKPLLYTVNFQNTGNDVAFDIVVKDKLDKNLNLETFEMITYSHPCKYKIVNNELIVTYSNINLPDSNHDEPNSHGYFMYKISPYKNFPNFTKINNTAYIYFDQNAAIITNTVSTLFGTVGIEESIFSGNNNIHLYPNPTTSTTTLEVNNLPQTNTSITLTDMVGRQLIQLTQTPNAEGKLIKEIDVSTLPKGMYFISVQNERMRVVSKLVVR
ncbi:MAG: T9SS type A sorting domain-containing protein [Bacteroidetes bacterium]|nr:T9SS type A sorting domain-containing protein [Bacteroidota bacterium]